MLVIYVIYYYYSLNSNENNNSFQFDDILFDQNSDFIKANENELEDFIEKFISENPKLILETVRNYQLEQSDIEKNETENQNKELINQLKLFQNDMSLGFNNANKTIYEFVDYNCGYCQKFHDVLIELINKDSDVRVEILQLPILGNSSIDLSKIVIASSLSGDFEKVHNYLYSSKRRNDIAEIFADLFLMDIDIKLLKENMNSSEVTSTLNRHKELSDMFKFNGTPALIIGAQIIPGYIELSKLMEILLEEFPD
ncbi:MAG: thioredoxin domain-containing protein, partial [Proteobacteria bacterium]|nr:thioredoxin domain-containing protein [Pseudomonadota bacterium]